MASTSSYTTTSHCHSKLLDFSLLQLTTLDICQFLRAGRGVGQLFPLFLKVFSVLRDNFITFVSPPWPGGFFFLPWKVVSNVPNIHLVVYKKCQNFFLLIFRLTFSHSARGREIWSQTKHFIRGAKVRWVPIWGNKWQVGWVYWEPA